jgi:Amidohydrolase
VLGAFPGPAPVFSRRSPWPWAILYGATQQQIQYGEQPGAAERTTLLLRDYHPKSMLHVPAHSVQRARFPVWDVHNHVDDSGGIGERIPPDLLVEVDDAQFGQEMVAQIDDAVRRGARGLKFLKDLGLGVRTSAGKRLRIDERRLDPVWDECGRLGIPVAMHTSDPQPFFTPVDGQNQRYEELKANPTWSF